MPVTEEDARHLAIWSLHAYDTPHDRRAALLRRGLGATVSSIDSPETPAVLGRDNHFGPDALVIAVAGSDRPWTQQGATDWSLNLRSGMRPAGTWPPDNTSDVERGLVARDNSDFRAALSGMAPGSQLHNGWVQGAASLWPNVDLIPDVRPRPHVWLTGHSAGGAMAAILACALTARGVPCTVVTFAGPAWGNQPASEWLADHADYVRYTSRGDVVPTFPPDTPGAAPGTDYLHTGEERILPAAPQRGFPTAPNPRSAAGWIAAATARNHAVGHYVAGVEERAGVEEPYADTLALPLGQADYRAYSPGPLPLSISPARAGALSRVPSVRAGVKDC